MHLAVDGENIFCVSGSALRLQKLEVKFHELPRYGKGQGWCGYTVQDAAAILLRYLQRLQEPIHPSQQVESVSKSAKTISKRSMVLSPVETGDDFMAEKKSCRLSIDVLNFLIENQENFIIVMSGQDDETWHWRPYLCHHLQ